MSENRSQLDERLHIIEDHLVQMMEMVSERISDVTSAMLEGDIASADRLIMGDDDIDLLSTQVEEACVATLVREAPVATDLRFVVGALHANSDIERSGDLVVNIAKAVGRLQGANPDDRIRELIAQMSDQAGELFRRVSEAFRARDTALAISVADMDDVLDDLHYRYIHYVIQEARRADLDPQHALQLALIGRFYERIGDHAENVGERIRYIVDGWVPEAQAAERAKARQSGELATPSPRGVAVIGALAAERRIDAIRRDFVANVSHELKTPVGAMSLLADTLAGDVSGADRERLGEMLMKEAKRVEDIIDDLLELTRLEESEPETELLDVDDIVMRSVEKVQVFALTRSVELATVGLPSDRQVMGDRRALVRAMANLIDNAVRYSDPNSQVTISVVDLGGSVELGVRDHGVGIPRAELERVFERFYRVDRARSRETGGTGLGLAIVRHVATNHGGRVSVDSKPGEGSEFVVTLPCVPRNSPTS
jgi:phosphate transport system regulatory protein PhoU